MMGDVCVCHYTVCLMILNCLCVCAWRFGVCRVGAIAVLLCFAVVRF